MNLYTVEESKFLLDTLVEGYETLIWTERYDDPGDFVLTTAKIEDTMALLPLDSFVSLNDTEEIMKVENHLITENEDGIEILEVTGRTFEVVYEKRTTIQSVSSTTVSSPITNPTTGENAGSYYYASVADCAVYALNLHRFVSFRMDARDDLTPHIARLWPGTTSGTPATKYLNRGDAYKVAINLCKEEGLGIKNKRPDAPNSSGLIGVVTYVYEGTNKTATVILDTKAGHFKKAKYLFSNKNYYNAVYVASQKNYRQVVASGASGLSGLDRHVALLEFPEITHTGTTVNSALDARGRTFLAKHKKTKFVEGEVSTNIPYKYKVDYSLGDLITCRGKYGSSGTMQVTEYVRIDDKTGSKEYPLLSAI